MAANRTILAFLVMFGAGGNANAQPADIEISALMKGRCELSIGDKRYGCKTAAYFLTSGRANFTVALDDSEDDGHVVSFSGSGTGGKITDNKAYALAIERMLLNSKHQPKANGLPVPIIKAAKGICLQTGNFAARQVQTITCSATDEADQKYSLQFESDGSPISIVRAIDERVVTQPAPIVEKSFVGKWYAEKSDACRVKPGEQDNGLVVYSQRKFEGYESTCDITKAVPQGNRFTLTMKCNAEGETSIVKENLELRDGKLVRLGRYPVTYTRCP